MAWLNESKGLENTNFERAIVFVHGLGGGAETWTGSSDGFVDVLRAEPNISDNFGLYVFTYATKIVEFSFFNKILSLIPGLKKREFNVGIGRIAMVLKGHLNELLGDYKTIVLVAHSMGGLIAKNALVEMEEEELKRIKLFMSLSVPHLGAPLANIGTNLRILLGENKQLFDLKSFSDLTSNLTHRFSQKKNLPKIIYQVGNLDEVVKEGSGIPSGVVWDNRIDTDDTHYTVLRISDTTTHVPYRRLIRELKNILNGEEQDKNNPVNDLFPKTRRILQEQGIFAMISYVENYFSSNLKSELSIHDLLNFKGNLIKGINDKVIDIEKINSMLLKGENISQRMNVQEAFKYLLQNFEMIPYA